MCSIRSSAVGAPTCPVAVCDHPIVDAITNAEKRRILKIIDVSEVFDALDTASRRNSTGLSIMELSYWTSQFVIIRQRFGKIRKRPTGL